MAADHKSIVSFIREIFRTKDFIPLHAPVFAGNEKKYVNDCIDSTFVSSVGKYVDEFESRIAKAAGTKHAVAVVNGTEALHIALLMVGVSRGDEVITQPLTFVATANAISYVGAAHVFLDVDKENLGLSPTALKNFLIEHCAIKSNTCINKKTGRRVSACVPVHIFGHPARIQEIIEICSEWHIPVVEDAAEGVGSYYRGRPLGGFGILGTFSFNGNKTITCGGGGAIVTDNQDLAKKAKHLTTTAKTPHRWEYSHDSIGFNYRLPNINAALACAQLEQLEEFVTNKRELASHYRDFFSKSDLLFVDEPAESKSNFWLNAVCFRDIADRNAFLELSNASGVMTRPCWQLMNRLPMFKDSFSSDLSNSEWLEARLVNIPSSVRIK
jgi:perosamine synthetase